MCSPTAIIGGLLSVGSTVLQNNSAKKAQNKRSAFTRNTIEKQKQAQDKSSAVIDRILQQQTPEAIKRDTSESEQRIEAGLHETLQSAQDSKSDASIGGVISNASKTQEARDLSREKAQGIELARLFAKLQAPKEQGFKRAVNQQRGSEQIAKHGNFLAGDASVNQLGLNNVQEGGSLLGDIGSSIGGDLLGKGLGSSGGLSSIFSKAPTKAWTGNAGNLTSIWG